MEMGPFELDLFYADNFHRIVINWKPIRNVDLVLIKGREPEI